MSINQWVCTSLNLPLPAAPQTRLRDAIATIRGGRLSQVHTQINHERPLSLSTFQVSKNQAAQLELAIRRGQLISKELMHRQASFLLVAMRQKILSLGPSYARRLTGLHDIHEVKTILDEAARSILKEVHDHPMTVEPGWLKELEKEEGK